MEKLYEKLTEDIKKIDINSIKNWSDDKVRIDIIQKQKEYLWVKIYLREEVDVNVGDEIVIKYLETGEELKTIFFYYGKKYEKMGLDVVVPIPVMHEIGDDEKILYVLVDQDDLNKTEDAATYIRTLFRQSKYYEHQLIKRSELIFTNSRTNEKLDYYDCVF
jgi:hypothetical protein